MKTLIELYDSEKIKNVTIALLYKPETIIYLIQAGDLEQEMKEDIFCFFQSKKLHSNVLFCEVDLMDAKAIDMMLSGILKNYKDIVFDMSGGEDLLLIQVNHFCVTHNLLQIYKDFDNLELRFILGDSDEHKALKLPYLSIEDYLSLYGAKLELGGHYCPDRSQKKRIELLKGIIKINFDYQGDNKWSKFVDYIQAAASKCSQREEVNLNLEAPMRIRAKSGIQNCDLNILYALEKVGAVKNIVIKNKDVRFRFIDDEIMGLLKVHGVWLELYVYFQILEINYFDDITMSAIVDWSPNDKNYLKNEIDLIAIRGVTPLFISCKSSMTKLSLMALYEIKILCEEFGGKRAKAVLLSTDDIYNKHYNLYVRARELDICILDKWDIDHNHLAEDFKEITEEKYCFRK
ncbi:MAG: DUF1887 family CARF protein [Eubacterium sp.]